MATPTQIREHRRDLAALVAIAEGDLRLLFQEFDTADAAKQALLDLLPSLVAFYSSAAATLGADWYDDLRDAAEARGRFTAVTAELPGRGRTDALAGWAVSPMFQAEPDKATTFSKVLGGTQRIIANADRQTVMASSVADPQARGWMRAGTGRCDFCRMLIGRGAVYTQATADFDSHDHCGCIGVPAF